MNVRLTCYWMVNLDDPKSWASYQREDDPESVEVEGVPFPMAFLRAVMMEGCGKAGAKVLASEGKGKWAFIDEVKFPWGPDARGGALVPFKSIAVDPKLFVLGKDYYAPQLKGVPLPDGSLHDGTLHACDTGGRIIMNHIDWFVGTRENWRAILPSLPTFINVMEVPSA